jgi:P27 family predicted phage terminase small subunit
MKRGPKPMPSALKVLRGYSTANPGDEPNVEPDIPEAPAWLTTEARTVWDYYAPRLLACRVLTPLDRDTLALYCDAIAEYAEAQRNIAATGRVVRGATGAPMENPWCRIARNAAERARKFGAELGLSPASRTQVKTSGPPQGGKLGRYVRPIFMG